MPLSQRKLNANRANAEKSTGPRSPEGKIISSANSGRHKILAATIVLANESATRFSAVLNTFYGDYNPQDATERAFVERMAVAHWRLMRIWAMETADLSREQELQTDATRHLDAPGRAAAAVHSISNSERHADPIGRKESRYSREFQTAYDALFRHRDRKIRNEATDLADSKQSTQPIEPKISAIEPTVKPIEPTSSPIEPTPKRPLAA